MKTPNPSGMRRDTFWDKILHAKRERALHWSYDSREAAKSKAKARKAALERLVASI